MKKIDEIDKNFKVETKLNKEDIKFHSVFEKPFSIHGLIYENGKFRRMPQKIADSTSEWVGYLNTNTSGGRVRFKTNSSYIAISAKMCNVGKMDHFAITGSGGFDMYTINNGVYKYNNTFRPPFEMQNGYESLFDFKSNEIREVVINFPLYSDVCELYIGLEKNATIEAPTPYKNKKPIVYYGHSITQGACASRPGNAYPSILSRKFDMDFINLGFSGSARGEREIAEYIASLNMEIFVYDYDHNAHSAEYLEQTHERMFKIIRQANPNLPIIMMSAMTMPYCTDNRAKRRDIVHATYQNAKNSGDKNVYFWDGSKEFEEYEDYGTVEGCHPNDHGLIGIATTLAPIMSKILNK